MDATERTPKTPRAKAPLAPPDPLDELLEAVDRDTVSWDKEAEPKIGGRVVGLDEWTSKHGSYPVVVLLTKDGREVTVPMAGTVLRREYKKYVVEIGDLLAVKYLGVETSISTGQPYNDYKLEVRDLAGNPKPRRAAPPADDTDAIDELDESLQQPAQPGEEPF
jgi:hypothetical protein